MHDRSTMAYGHFGGTFMERCMVIHDQGPWSLIVLYAEKMLVVYGQMIVDEPGIEDHQFDLQI